MEKQDYIRRRKLLLQEAKLSAKAFPSLASTYNEAKWQVQLTEMETCLNRMADAAIVQNEIKRMNGIDS